MDFIQETQRLKVGQLVPAFFYVKKVPTSSQTAIHDKILTMSEKIPYREPVPEELEIRRDALLLRIVELRQAIKSTRLNQNIVSEELNELDKKVQEVEGLLDIALFEEIFDSLEKIVDSKK